MTDLMNDRAMRAAGEAWLVERASIVKGMNAELKARGTRLTVRKAPRGVHDQYRQFAIYCKVHNDRHSERYVLEWSDHLAMLRNAVTRVECGWCERG